MRQITYDSQTIGDYSSAEKSFTQCQLTPTVDCAVNDWGSEDWAFGAYLQDDFRVSPRVTLNLGLRWDAYDYLGVWHQANNRTYLALNAIGSPYGASNPKTQWDEYQPRVGLAWDVRADGKDVVRASYGKFYVLGIQNSFYTKLRWLSTTRTLLAGTGGASWTSTHC